MWLVADYRPVTLFSLRSGLATASGAKTVLVPTPFAIRTALLDAAIRTEGLAQGQKAFTWLKTLSLAIRPPEQIVVTNLFAKILKPTRKGEEAERAMDRTIAFREYAYLQGTISLAFGTAEEQIPELQALLAQVNYFGKRGSFFQLLTKPQPVSTLPKGFVPMDGVYLQDANLRGQMPEVFVPGIIQTMDDWGEDLTFAKVNVYTDEKIALGRDRVRKSVVLPYRPVRSSKGFTLYERLSEA